MVTEILYADDKLVVCVKPAGVLSTDEPGGMPSLLRAALGAEGNIYSVHRLDAPVGGVMVYARTRHAASDLGKAVMEGRLHKEYRAVLRGVPAEKTGELRDLLYRDRRQRRTLVAAEPGPETREASLTYEILAQKDGLSLVSIVLHTGRPHQIRCQFASRGLPLWGDRKYGGGEEAEPIALWSARLGFPHPVTGEERIFEKQPPAISPWTVFKEADG